MKKIANVKLSIDETKSIYLKYVTEVRGYPAARTEIINVFHLENGEYLLELEIDDDDATG